jgi:hypothetical protein
MVSAFLPKGFSKGFSGRPEGPRRLRSGRGARFGPEKAAGKQCFKNHAGI